jgi:hypothetical protein
VEEKQLRSTIHHLVEIRKKSTEYLPIDHSFIPHDILLLAVQGALDQNHHTVKSLFAELPYSDMGLRYHFRRLITNGWLEIDLSQRDLRVRIVKPTDKCLNQFSKFVAEIQPKNRTN